MPTTSCPSRTVEGCSLFFSFALPSCILLVVELHVHVYMILTVFLCIQLSNSLDSSFFFVFRLDLFFLDEPFDYFYNHPYYKN